MLGLIFVSSFYWAARRACHSPGSAPSGFQSFRGIAGRIRRHAGQGQPARGEPADRAAGHHHLLPGSCMITSSTCFRSTGGRRWSPSAAAPRALQVRCRPPISTSPSAWRSAVFLLVIYYSVKMKGVARLRQGVPAASLQHLVSGAGSVTSCSRSRSSRASGVAGPAIVRQHVRRRADHDPDRPVRAAAGLARSERGRLGLDRVQSSCWAWLWSIFHVLIIMLQAFIFMMLTIVYLSMAHEHQLTGSLGAFRFLKELTWVT